MDRGPSDDRELSLQKSRSMSIEKAEPERSEPLSPRILFASDPRERVRRDEIYTLPLSRTFSRNSYSSAVNEETARVRRLSTGRVEPQLRLPTGTSSPWHLSNSPEYRTLSIHVSDTISHGVPPAKGPIKTIAELDWHMLPSQEALQRLGSSETQGLDNNQAQRRLQQYGKNVVSPPPTNHIRKTYVYRNVC